MLYKLVWRKLVEYPLVQLVLPSKQLDDIKKKALPKIYSKCKYNRNTKQEILKGPTALEGGGFTPLEASAGSGYIMHLLKHWRSSEEESSKMICILYAWNVMSAGVSFPLLKHPEIESLHLKGKIIPAIQVYLADIRGKIHLDNTMIQPPLQKNDMCLMNVAIEMDLTPNQLNQLNCVQKWFNVKYLSKLCNEEGTMI